MSTTDHYGAKLSIISAIPDNRITAPAGIPVNIYIQEIENLHNWCQPDREKLTANGLQWALVEDLPARIDTLREAQARWENSDMNNILEEKLWDEKSPAARLFRKELIRSMKFSFRNNRPLITKLEKFSEGQSNAAMIQSLRGLSIFGKEHIDILKSGNFDITKLDTAAEMSRELAAVLGAVKSRRAFCSDSLRLRNQAYTYLKEAVTEIKMHAQFVLVNEPLRLKGYTSDYNRKKYLKNRSRKEQIVNEKVTA